MDLEHLYMLSNGMFIYVEWLYFESDGWSYTIYQKDKTPILGGYIIKNDISSYEAAELALHKENLDDCIILDTQLSCKEFFNYN